MIRLHQFPPAWGLPNASTFCLKLETWLRMARLPYESVYGLELHKAPKGKLPWVEVDGVQVADSGFAIDYLKQKYGDLLDAWLGPEQRAVAHAFRRLVEENLYWCVVHMRWADEANWALTREEFFRTLPLPLRAVVPAVARRGLLREMHGHGMGRHSVEEIYRIGRADLQALSDFLGGKRHFMGDPPCTLDAVAYGVLAVILWTPGESPLRERMLALPNLVAFCEHMRGDWWADYRGA